MGSQAYSPKPITRASYNYLSDPMIFVSFRVSRFLLKSPVHRGVNVFILNFIPSSTKCSQFNYRNHLDYKISGNSY